MPQVAAGR
jgi:undecaprenyl-diphosphatase